MSSGKRRGAKVSRGFDAVLLVLALGTTACVVGWGYLVYAAIDFGSSARGGESAAWWLLALASVGAVACLFAGLMLVTRASRRLGLSQAPKPPSPPAPPPPTPEVTSAQPRRSGGARRAR